MAWNDGITEEMSEYLSEIAQASSRARAVGESVIDEEVRNFSARVEPKIPVASGGLHRSFTVEKDTSDSKWYGYNVEFKGEAPNGEPYQKIANILNYGTPRMAGSFFITNAVRRLKGMTDRINARIEAELDAVSDK